MNGRGDKHCGQDLKTSFWTRSKKREVKTISVLSFNCIVVDSEHPFFAGIISL